MSEKSSIFDMIGPVMIGPSSSHTAGVVRIARVAVKLLGEIPDKAEITFYNSFARTYEGHGSDRAIVGGLMDFKTDDKRIKDALDIARQRGMTFSFKPVGSASVHHPNTIRIKAYKDDKQIEVLGISRGGGLITIKEVDGFNANFTASLHTMLVWAEDRKGKIAFITEVLSQDDCNIATMTVSRKGKNSLACHIIEMDSGIRPITYQYLQSLSGVSKVTYIPDIDN
jgi:L-serine dehydratase